MLRVLVVVVAVSSLAAANTSPASANRGCGRVAVTHGGFTSHFRVEIARGEVSCEAARWVIKAYNSGKGKLHKPGPGRVTWYTTLRGGWKCFSGAGGAEGCVRGPKINEYEHQVQVYANPV